MFPRRTLWRWNCPKQRCLQRIRFQIWTRIQKLGTLPYSFLHSTNCLPRPHFFERFPKSLFIQFFLCRKRSDQAWNQSRWDHNLDFWLDNQRPKFLYFRYFGGRKLTRQSGADQAEILRGIRHLDVVSIEYRSIFNWFQLNRRNGDFLVLWRAWIGHRSLAFFLQGRFTSSSASQLKRIWATSSPGAEAAT